MYALTLLVVTTVVVLLDIIYFKMDTIVKVTLDTSCSTIWSVSLLADINECDTDNGGCEQGCVNQDGSFHCNCSDGYILSNNKLNCTCEYH